MEAQFLEWYQIREQVVSGEAHYKAVLEAARLRDQAFNRGYRAGFTDLVGLPFPLTNDQGVCDHDTSCSCYAEGHAAGMAEANAKRQCDALEDAGYEAPHQTGAPQRADARRNRAKPANCLHTEPSPKTAAVSDHMFTTSPLKWAMINCLEALGNRLMPTPGTGQALNKGRTVHPNPENNRATPWVTGRTARSSN